MVRLQQLNLWQGERIEGYVRRDVCSFDVELINTSTDDCRI